MKEGRRALMNGLLSPTMFDTNGLERRRINGFNSR